MMDTGVYEAEEGDLKGLEMDVEQSNPDIPEIGGDDAIAQMEARLAQLSKVGPFTSVPFGEERTDPHSPTRRALTPDHDPPHTRARINLPRARITDGHGWTTRVGNHVRSVVGDEYNPFHTDYSHHATQSTYRFPKSDSTPLTHHCLSLHFRFIPPHSLRPVVCPISLVF